MRHSKIHYFLLKWFKIFTADYQSDMSLQVCHCGWSKMTTYQGLRIHQGKMGCTPKGVRIPEREQYVWKNQWEEVDQKKHQPAKRATVKKEVNALASTGGMLGQSSVSGPVYTLQVFASHKTLLLLFFFLLHDNGLLAPLKPQMFKWNLLKPQPSSQLCKLASRVPVNANANANASASRCIPR